MALDATLSEATCSGSAGAEAAASSSGCRPAQSVREVSSVTNELDEACDISQVIFAEICVVEL